MSDHLTDGIVVKAFRDHHIELQPFLPVFPFMPFK
jgi:hypothetical protein